MNFKEELEQRTQIAWAVVEEYLPKEEGFSGNLAKAINYSMRPEASVCVRFLWQLCMKCWEEILKL